MHSVNSLGTVCGFLTEGQEIKPMRNAIDVNATACLTFQSYCTPAPTRNVMPAPAKRLRPTW
jgi:hypothetical protein